MPRGPLNEYTVPAIDAPDEPLALSRAMLAERDDTPRLAALAGALRAIDPARLDDDRARTAFWINVYNALVCHGLAHRGARGSLLLQRGFFSSAAYTVGVELYSLNVIEHGLLRANRRPPLSPWRTLAEGDPRRARGPGGLDPRIHFALNCGARSCPAVGAYTASGLDAELDAATQSYIEQEASLDRGRATLTAPFLCRLYRGDFGDDAAIVRFVSAHMTPSDRAWIDARAGRVSLRFGPYDWTIATHGPR